ncbi:HEPN domain-containing protein [Streptomyces sp. NPDC005732]|uniref:ApeA N-terminal domain 1-containing protein n=1 Tax=Streptomyces sp. NPDC005732 TaxID=3157057 RepID=UPI0033E696BF
MDDTTALKVNPQPDTYRCTWHLPHDGQIVELPGELVLRANRPPEGAVYAEVPGVWTVTGPNKSAGFPQDREFSTVRCSLENGLQAVLVDCVVSIWMPNRAAVYGRYALVGKQLISDTPLFDRLKVQVSGVDSLFGRAPIKGFRMPVPQGKTETGLWSVEREPESAQEWSDEEVTLTASFDSSTTMADPYYFRMCHSPSVLIDLKNPMGFDDFLKGWVSPLLDFSALALGKPQRITYFAIGNRASAVDRSGWERFQVYGSGIHQEPFNSTLKEIRRNHSVVNWSDDERSPLDVLREWQKLVEVHHPLVETYGSFLNVRAQHPRARFLLLLQALEGLHGYENKANEDERAELHRERKANILEALKSCLALNPKERKFLKTNISNRPPMGLDSRLGESFSQLPAGIVEALDEAELVVSLMDDPRQPKGSCDALRLIRNDLAHGNKGYPVESLDVVAKILERATRAHFLRILGYSSSVQLRAVNPGEH